jgi:hypothetical protein
MPQKFFSQKAHNRNPYCANAANCKGLCGCVLVTKQELKDNKACPKALKCKHSSGCMQTIADIDCPVCAGLKTEFEISTGELKKCLCSTCNRNKLRELSAMDDIIRIFIDTPDGQGLTISNNSDIYYQWMKKISMLLKITA